MRTGNCAAIARLAAGGVGARPSDPRIAKRIAWVAPRLDERPKPMNLAASVGLLREHAILER
jgi:hypothetical protein